MRNASSDASVPLLNPAGILAVDAGLLSFATRFVRIGVREIEGFRQVGAPIGDAKVADPDATDVTFVVRPSGTCYFGRILSGPKEAPNEEKRPHKFSFCAYQSEKGDLERRDREEVRTRARRRRRIRW